MMSKKQKDLSKTTDWKIRSSELTAALRGRSGTVESEDPLVCFFYLLMRDELPIGRVAQIAKEALISSELNEGRVYTNGWLATYAKDLVEQLRGAEHFVKKVSEG